MPNNLRRYVDVKTYTVHTTYMCIKYLTIISRVTLPRNGHNQLQLNTHYAHTSQHRFYYGVVKTLISE